VAQKGRKNAVIVSFLLDVPTLALIDQIVEDSKQWKLPLDGRSDWIKRAIRRELDHRQRSRRRKTHGPEIPVAAQLPRASVAERSGRRRHRRRPRWRRLRSRAARTCPTRCGAWLNDIILLSLVRAPVNAGRGFFIGSSEKQR
jgi:hypothetical protein